ELTNLDSPNLTFTYNMAAIQSQLDSRIITMASFLLKSTTSVLALAFAPAVFAQSATPAATAPAGQPQVTLNQIVEQTLWTAGNKPQRINKS
ncbi:hypothetical protein CTI14_52420, partial [Methylobacterium radiotolerans]